MRSASIRRFSSRWMPTIDSSISSDIGQPIAAPVRAKASRCAASVSSSVPSMSKMTARIGLGSAAAACGGASERDAVLAMPRIWCVRCNISIAKRAIGAAIFLLQPRPIRRPARSRRGSSARRPGIRPCWSLRSGGSGCHPRHRSGWCRNRRCRAPWRSFAAATFQAPSRH